MTLLDAGDDVTHDDSPRVYRGNLGKLVTKIDAERDIDLGQYRPEYLERRIAARLRTLGLHSYRQYADYLDKHPDEFSRLLNTITINVTDFFRDKPVYDLLRRVVFPEIIKRKRASRHRMLRVWSAGCSTGEEPYSATILALEALGAYEKEFMLSVLGTDLDLEALAVARKGEYPAERLKNVPRHVQVKYFERHGDVFHVRREVADHVKFRRLNLFDDRPIQVVDVILCRNVFIYFTREQQARVIDGFWSALARGGYLVLGRSEKMPANIAQRFELVNGRERVYRKSNGA